MNTHSQAQNQISKDLLSIQMNLINKIDSLLTEIGLTYNKNKNIYEGIKESLIEPMRYSLNSEAKRIRPLFCYWFQYNFNVSDSEKIEKIKNVMTSIEILHNASLIIDDIEDGSTERRGKNSLHIEFGVPNAINVGSWLYFFALQSLPKEFRTLGLDALYDCHLGQSLDLSHANHKFVQKVFMTHFEENWSFYKKSTELKTTRLMHLAIQCLSDVCEIKKAQKENLLELFRYYGLSFQIFDDLKNILPHLSGSKSFEDLKSGLRSSLTLFFLKSLDLDDLNVAYESYINNFFIDYMINHKNFNSSVLETIKIASIYLKNSSSLLNQICTNEFNRDYAKIIMEEPLESICKNLFYINMSGNIDELEQLVSVVI